MRRAALALLCVLCAGVADSAASRPSKAAEGQECFSVLGDGKDSRICFDPIRRPAPPPPPEVGEPRADSSRPSAGKAGPGKGNEALAELAERHNRDLTRALSRARPASAETVVPMGPPTSKADAHLPLQPVRALIAPSEMPPAGVAAYGMVAFPALPLTADRERFEAVCQAFRTTLLAPDQVAGTPVSAQMITFWPVRDRQGLPDDPPCEAMIDRYDLKAGLDAIRDADTRKDGLAARRGPFLIAWSPSLSRARPDAVILVIDMSAMSSAKSFQDVFVQWRQKIIDDPKFWRNGFSLETIRLALRDALDAYGARLTPLFEPGK